MSGDEPLGDDHTHWHSAEESLVSNGMSCSPTCFVINGIVKHENASVKKAPWCTN